MEQKITVLIFFDRAFYVQFFDLEREISLLADLELRAGESVFFIIWVKFALEHGCSGQ